MKEAEKLRGNGIIWNLSVMQPLHIPIRMFIMALSTKNFISTEKGTCFYIMVKNTLELLIMEVLQVWEVILRTINL